MKLDIKIIYALIWVLDGERRPPDDLDTGGGGAAYPGAMVRNSHWRGCGTEDISGQVFKKSGVEVLESRETGR